MTEKQDRATDALVEEVRSRRRELVEKHGGLREWAAHLRREQAKQPGRLLSLPDHAPRTHRP